MAAGKLHRSRNAYVAGVCAGIAETCNLDTVVVRILAILLVLATFGIGAIVYVVLWLLLPLERPDPKSTASFEVTPVLVNSENRSASPFGVVPTASAQSVASAPAAGKSPLAAARAAGAESSELADNQRLSAPVRIAVAVGLVALFFIASMNISPLLRGTHWWQFWPAAFLIVGLCLIVIPVHIGNEVAWHAIGIALSSVSALLVPISVGFLSWDTIPYACSTLWFVLVGAAALFCIGAWRGMGSLMIAGAVCVMVFCLFALFFLGVPGDIEELAFLMPSGRMYIMGPGFAVHQFSWLLAV